MAQSLLGVVSGLQMMEDNFLKILMEAALKLASLTDASLFILCETQEGRRFAGQRDLCDAYRGGQLVAHEADVEMEIGGTAGSELKARRTGSLSSSAAADDDQECSVVEGPPLAGARSPTVIDDAEIVPLTVNASRKRSSGGGLGGWPLNKLARRSTAAANRHLAAEVNADTFDASLPLTLDDRGNWVDEFHHHHHHDDGGVDVKAFPHELDEDPTVVTSASDADSHIDGAASSKPPSSHIEKLDNIVERWRPSRPAAIHAASLSSAVALPSAEPPDNGAAHSNFEMKVEALKRIPGQKFEQTNSDEFRLLSSCMYEFGRNTSDKYLRCLQDQPDLPHRPFFVQEYEHWAAQFLNIHPFGNVMIKKENRESKRTLTAYMRKIAGDAFGICIKKRLKKQKEFQSKSFDQYNNSNGLAGGVQPFHQSLPFDSTEMFT